MLLGIVGFAVGVVVGVTCKEQVLKLVEVIKGLVSKFKKKD